VVPKRLLAVLSLLIPARPATFAAIKPHLEVCQDMTIRRGGQEIRIDGIGFVAVGGLCLLSQDAGRSAGAQLIIISCLVHDRRWHKGAHRRHRFGPTFDLDQRCPRGRPLT